MFRPSLTNQIMQLPTLTWNEIHPEIQKLIDRMECQNLQRSTDNRVAGACTLQTALDVLQGAIRQANERLEVLDKLDADAEEARASRQTEREQLTALLKNLPVPTLDPPKEPSQP